MSSSDNLKKGDEVEWKTQQGPTQGTVVDKVTSDTKRDDIGANGVNVKASKDDPKYVIESDKTGKRAAHKADALEKL